MQHQLIRHNLLPMVLLLGATQLWGDTATRENSDHAAIIEAARDYAYGVANLDTERLESAFAMDQAQLKLVLEQNGDPTVYVIPIRDLMERVWLKLPVSENHFIEVMDLNVVSDRYASIVINNNDQFIDQLALYRVGDNWKIVDKLAIRHPSAPPASGSLVDLFGDQTGHTIAMNRKTESKFAESEWPRTMATSHDGTSIAWYQSGNGRVPLVAISGGPGSDHRYMRSGGSFDALSEQRRVITFDQRGTSASGAASDNPRLSQWVEDVEAVRAMAGAERIDLLGHSFGGMVAMAYAERFPERVRSMILADSTAPSLADTKAVLADIYPDRIDQWRRTRSELTPQFKAEEMDVFFSMEFVEPGMSDAYREAVTGLTYSMEINAALRTDLQKIDMREAMAGFEKPVLVVHGRFDAVIAPSVAWDLHQLFPDSRIRFIEAAGHLPFFERPATFVQIIEEFLNSLEEFPGML